MKVSEKIPMIIIPDNADRKIAEDTCNKVIDIITKISRTDLRIFIMKNLVDSFEESHDCKLITSTMNKR